ncbi:MAG: ABC transporter permease [Acidobacteria bacterium]|nr:ABC transporter permease [Acidobacteriota bacterium]
MIAQDLRIGARTLRRSSGFVITAVATLALAIGANTAIFSLISFVLLRPLPYPDADRIVQFLFTTPGGSSPILSIPEVNALTAETALFEDVAAYDFGGPGVNITGSDEPEQVRAIHVSAAYFRLFGAEVARGRTFTADEDRPNGGRVVVLSHELWRRHFGGDGSRVGRTISLGGEPFTVVGVLAPGFRPDPPAQIWFPLQADPNSIGHAHYIRAAARLRGSVSAEQANARLKLTFAEFLRRFPLFNPKAGFQVKPLREVVTGDVRTALLVLLGTVILVLLIACSNVANLLLARATARQHEIAVRASLGANRARLISQLLTECLLLAALGGILGLAVGRVCLQALVKLNPEAVPGSSAFDAVSLDWRVLSFTAAISLAATLVCGLVPALRASRVNLASEMQESGTRAGASRATVRAKSLLVVVQVALAVMLVVGAGLMIRTFAALRQVGLGIDPRRTLTLQMSLQGTRFQDTGAVARLVENGVESLQGVPGVIAAASTWSLPLELAFGSTFIIEGRPLGSDKVHGSVLMRPVSSNYLTVFGIPLKRGRFFTDSDTTRAGSVAVISEAMAKKFWPEGNPIGERITIDKYLGQDFAAPPREIIGVAADVRDAGLNKEPGPMVYVPQAQVPNGMTRINAGIMPITWAIHTAVEPYSLSVAMQRQLRIASGGLAVGRIRSMDDVVKQSTARSDFNAILLTTFAGAALLLAAVGIYGLISFSVQQRTRELGIRLALGATPHQVQTMVVRQGLGLTVIGVFVGAAGSMALARYMEALLFGVKPVDPVVIAVSSLTLGSVAVLASYIPARRAARIDPVEVLRAA